MKKIIFICALTVLTLLVSCQNAGNETNPVIPETPEEETSVKVTGIEISSDFSGDNIYVGDSFTLSAAISPSNADNKEVEWASSDETLATVSDEGLVTALKETESVIIYAKSKDGSNVTGSFTFSIYYKYSILSELELYDDYGYKMENNGDFYIPNNPKGDTASSNFYIKNNSSKTITITPSTLASKTYIHIDDYSYTTSDSETPISLGNNSYNHPQIESGKYFCTTFASYSSVIGEHTTTKKYIISYDDDSSEELLINVHSCACEKTSNFKIVEEPSAPIYLEYGTEPVMNFTITNEGPNVPRNIRVSASLEKNFYSGEVTSGKITGYPLTVEQSSQTRLHPLDSPVVFKISSSTKEWGYFTVSLTITYDYYDFVNKTEVTDKQVTKDYTLYIKSDAEVKLTTSEITQLLPLGVFGKRPYFITEYYDSLYTMDEDENFISLGLCVKNILRVDEKLYFSNKGDSEKQSIYCIDEDGLTELASSTKGLDLEKPCKIGNYLFFTNDNILSGSGSDYFVIFNLTDNTYEYLMYDESNKFAIRDEGVATDGRYVYYSYSNGLRGILVYDAENSSYETIDGIINVEYENSFMCKGSLYLYFNDSYWKMNGSTYEKAFDGFSTNKDLNSSVSFDNGNVLLMFENDGAYVCNGDTIEKLLENVSTCSQAIKMDDNAYWIEDDCVRSYDGTSLKSSATLKYYESGENIALYKSHKNDDAVIIFYPTPSSHVAMYNTETGYSDYVYYLEGDKLGRNFPIIWANQEKLSFSLCWNNRLYFPSATNTDQYTLYSYER